MKRIKMPGVWAGMALLVAVLMVAPVWGQDEQFIPLFVYRTGPYAPNGIPVANGYVDYIKLLNARDGGINGVKITWEECETKYNTKLGVECYERLKKQRRNGRLADQSLQHRHHLSAHPQGVGGQAAHPLDGLRAHRGG